MMLGAPSDPIDALVPPDAAFALMFAESFVRWEQTPRLPARAWLLEKEGLHAQRFRRLATR